MFTGIITDLGSVVALHPKGGRDGVMRMEIEAPFSLETLSLGASIACNGCCLTVVEKAGSIFAVEISDATLSCTTLGSWKTGDRIHLERALKLGDELGGHLVSGHIDGVAVLKAQNAEAGSLRLVLETPQELARFIAAKGSVALDGVSLTVNAVSVNQFVVNLIPATLEKTTLGDHRNGDRLNLEIDLLARYTARLAEYSIK